MRATRRKTEARPARPKTGTDAASPAAVKRSRRTTEHATKAADPTVREAMKRWLVVQGLGKRPATRKHQGECALIIERNFGDLDRPVSEITAQECEAFAARIAHYSASRYNGTLHALRKVLPQASHIPAKKVRTEERSTLTQEEFDRLLAELDMAIRGNAGLVVRLLALTGLRINEASNLRWADVKADHILVPGRFTKNGKSRSIPMLDGVDKVLAALREVSTHERVLPHKRCTNALRLACRRCGLPRIGHHAFRHLFATRCIMSGVDVPTVAKWLGHSDNGALLLRTYCHLLDSHSKAMAGRVQIETRVPAATATPGESPVPPRNPPMPMPVPMLSSVTFNGFGFASSFQYLAA